VAPAPIKNFLREGLLSSFTAVADLVVIACS
jgi:hypothetical protein